MAFEWYSEDYCCEFAKDCIEGGWSMGSHYHCGECGGLCSMMGHWRRVHFVKGKAVDVAEHYCCDRLNCQVT